MNISADSNSCPNNNFPVKKGPVTKSSVFENISADKISPAVFVFQRCREPGMGVVEAYELKAPATGTSRTSSLYSLGNPAFKDMT